MPRTIYQQNEQTYIGHDIHQGTDHEFVVPVFDQELDIKYRLNALSSQVDYEIVEVDHESAVVEWRNRPDFITIKFILNAFNRPERVLTATPATDHLRITNLQPNTLYEINVIAELPWGTTESHRDTFKTSIDPIPAAITGFHYTDRTNSSISFQWDRDPVSVKYAIYRSVGMGSMTQVATAWNTTITLDDLRQDTKYRFAVRGVNADGRHGPQSAIIRSATGHDAIVWGGMCRRFVIPPRRCGSWQYGLGWRWWHRYWEHSKDSLFQGYRRYNTERMWGLIEYDPEQIRTMIDERFGAGVSRNLTVHEASLRQVYRRPTFGNVTPLQLEWHLSNGQVDSPSEPTIIRRHVNDRDSADSRQAHRTLAADRSIEFLRLPRSWGRALILGKDGNTPVRSISLYRADSEWDGYGYGGYLEIGGHRRFEWEVGVDYSDLSLVLYISWKFIIRSYKGPYDW